MKYAIFLPLFMLLTACGSQLQKPFCRGGLSEFPASMLGTYTVTMPQVDPSINNATTFSEQTIEVKKDGLVVPAGTSLWAQANLPDGNRICKIGNHIYSEKLNDNSTYTITRIDPTQYGLAFSDLSFSVEDLKEKNIPFIVVPNLQLLEGTDTTWTKGYSIGSNPLVIDNTNVAVEDLIAISKRVSLFITMNRVSTKLKGPSKFIPLSSLK